MTLVLVTGGPGSGKTSLCEELSAYGFTTVPESGRAVIRRFGQRPQPADFGRAMLDLDLAHHHRHRTSSVPVFFDRGLPDLAAFAAQHQLADMAVFHDAITQNRYHSVAFIAPPWPEILCNDGERDQSFAEAVATHQRLVAGYRSHGYELVELPRATVAERCAFVVDRCRQFIPPHSTNAENRGPHASP